jgi:hypothetical protein
MALEGWRVLFGLLIGSVVWLPFIILCCETVTTTSRRPGRSRN